MAIVVKRSVTGGDTDLRAEMFELFYPVGSFYETSDTSFDPNTAWGGAWVEDTAGRVLVAQDTATFATAGDTGGTETTNQAFFRPALNSGNMQDMGNNYVENIRARVDTWLQANGSSQLTLDNQVASVGGTVRTQGTTATEAGFFKYTSTTLQPYLVIKRWHRIA